MTAAELMERLQSDPAHAARSRRREQQRQAAAAGTRAAAAPLIAELRAAGHDVERVSELHERRLDYRDALPVLIRWLPAISDRRLKEAVVRALTVPWARPVAAPVLIREFRDADDATGSYRWAVGNALSVVADDSVLPDIVALATDRRYGKAREMVVLALGNMSDPRAVDALVDLLPDEEVAGHAVMALGKLRAPSARAALEPFLDHPKDWVRQEARKALASLDR